jgi:hypothetical protein
MGEENYNASLINEGFLKETIRAYSFTFKEKKVWIDDGDLQKVNSILKTAKKEGYRKNYCKKERCGKEINLS